MKYIKKEGIIDKEGELGLLLFDMDSGKMVELNSTAKLLWEKTSNEFSLEDCKDIINKHCEDIPNLDDDLNEFIQIALKNDLVKNGEN